MNKPIPDALPLMYTDIAEWFPLITCPEDYAEEAEFYRKQLVEACIGQPVTLLELGSGGGNNASHLKANFQMTLVDLSPQMLSVSRSINPECEHIQGDMRTVRLNRLFDVVFVHDAVMYLTCEEDLHAAMKTAWVHLKPGGVALFCPDFVKENFQPGADHGGHDRGTCSLRYLEWIWDPDPCDNTYIVDFAYILREGNDQARCLYDRHRFGLFTRQTWLDLLRSVGFEAKMAPFIHSEVEGGEDFLALKPLV